MENKKVPKISVILPVYNHREYLCDAVQSIIAQTFQDWELIIINDDPRYNLLHYHNVDKRIKVIQLKEHKRKPFCLNLGISMAKGEYIAFQDADDISYPFRLKTTLDYLIKHKCDCVVADNIYVGFKKHERIYSQSPEPNRKAIRSRPLGNFGSILIKKEVARKILFTEGIGYGEDWIWEIGIMSITDNIRRMPLPVYLYRHFATTFWNHTLRKIPIIRKLYRLNAKKKIQKRVKKELKKYNYNV